MNKQIKLGLLVSLLLALPFVAHGQSIEKQLLQPLSGFTLLSLLRGIGGVLALLFIAWLLSRDRRHIDWRSVGLALLCQLLLAISILYIPPVQLLFEWFGKGFLTILDCAGSGSRFLFGPLADQATLGHIFAFQTLPTIVFFAALMGLFYYYGIIQAIVKAIAYPLKKILRLSGAEGITVAGNIFLGQCEAPLLARHYLATMNRSEIFLIMSAGLATIAGGVMAAYIGMLGGGDPQARVQFAKYLLSASVMAAPGVIAIARIIMPQTESITDKLDISKKEVGSNVIDAVSKGAAEGLKLALSIGALLLVFIALVTLANELLGGIIGKYTGLNGWITQCTDGRYTALTFQFLLGILFTPIVWLMGVCTGDIIPVGGLLGTKLVLNEFVAYADLNQLKNAGTLLQEKSVIIATYMLCGFANVGSVGMIIGGLSPLAPNQRPLFTRYGFLAMICGALASCMSATMVGMIVG